MKTIGQLLKSKGQDVWTVKPESSVFEALEIMAEKNCGALLVVEGESLVGIFSERDYARKVVLRGKMSRDIPVREIMTEKVEAVRPDQTIRDCMSLMTEKHIRHLPVLQDGKLVGVISIGDVVKEIISEQQFIIEQLENYITGGR